MTLSQLLALTQNRLDDTSTPRLWSDVELTSFADQMINILCEQIPILVDFTTPAICTISILSGTSSYALDPRIIFIRDAYLGSSASLLRTTFNELQVSNGSWRSVSGTPQVFLTDMASNTIVLYPKPDANATLTLQVVRYPLLPLDSTVVPSMTPEIPARFHSLLIPGITSLAYRKSDAETENLARAQADEIEWIKNVEKIKRFYLNKHYSPVTAVPHGAFL